MIFADFSSNNMPVNIDRYEHPLVALKVTEGASYRWLAYPQLADAAHTRGITCWHYHFARPGDYAAQAARFTGLTRTRPGDRLVLDLEDDAMDSAAGAACIAAFHRAVPDLIVYASPSYLTGRALRAPAGVSLWQAEYGPTLTPVPGWPPPAAWQYTDRGTTSACPGPVDLSRLLPDQTTPSIEEDQVRLIRAQSGHAIAVTDWLTKRIFVTPQEMAEVQHTLHDQTVIVISDSHYAHIPTVKG